MQKISTKKNILYQIIYQILTLILPLITSPYIARVIGAEGLGIYTYSFSVAFYFVLVSMLGLVNHGNRAIAQVRDNQEELNCTFSDLLTLHIVLSIVCLGVYLVYSASLGKDRIYAYIQLFYILSGLFDISWFYFGIEQFKLTVIRNTIIKIFNIICVFGFVKTSSDLWKYCLIMALGYFLSQLSLWFPLKRYVSFVRPSWERMRIHIKPLLILFIPAIAVSMYKYMDKIMIGVLSSKSELGFYENAEKIVNIPVTTIAAFGTVMLPKMSNLFVSADQSESNRFMSISIRYIMCLSFAFAFGLAGVATIFAPVFWGKDFAMSGYLIIGLSVTLPFIAFANIIRTQYLIPREKDKLYVVSVVCGAIINLLVNYLLIGTLGAIGAMVGTIIAEITVCVIQTVGVQKELRLSQYFKELCRYCLFGAVMYCLVFFVGTVMGKSIITLLVQIALGIISYMGLALIYLIRIEDEFAVQYFNKIIRILKLK